VMLTAIPAGGYVFGNWSGHTEGIDDVTQSPVTFRMGDRPDDNRVITANFLTSDLRYSISILATPEGGGSVRLEPVQPTEGYPINETVTVIAVANPGYVFTRWSGALGGTENPRSIRLSQHKSVAAIFNPTVSVYCSPSEGGSVSLQPESTGGYAPGTQVTLPAKPAKGYRFVGWDGDLSSSANSVTITVDEAKTITARFAKHSASRPWLWVIIGAGGLFVALVVIRLVYTRVGRAALVEPADYD
jgi:uncharacterized repeat protein (TIGR02543 family)